MQKLSGFTDAAAALAERMPVSDPECAAIRSELQTALHRDRLVRILHESDPASRTFLRDIRETLESLRTIFICLKCVEKKKDPVCREISALTSECIALIAQTISSLNGAHKAQENAL